LTSINLSNECSFIALCCSSSKEEIRANINNSFVQQFDWQYLLKLTYLHGLSGILYNKISFFRDQVIIPSFFLDALKNNYLCTAYQNMLLIKEYNNINQLFHNNHIKNIPLKGIYYLKELYDDPGVRPLSDIDILVHRHDLKKAEQVLKNIGYIKKKRLIENNKNMFHEIYHRKQKSVIFTIELHWDIDFPDSPFKVQIEELWARAERIQNGLCFFYAFSLEDDIIFNCVHILRHLGILPLKNFCDLSNILSKYSERIDWDAIIERSEHYNVSRPVYIVLLLMQTLFHASVPFEKIDKLRKPGFHEHMLWTIISENIFTKKAPDSLLPKILINRISDKFDRNIFSLPLSILKTLVGDLQANYYHDIKPSFIRALLKTISSCFVSIRRYSKVIYMVISTPDSFKRVSAHASQTKHAINEVSKWIYYS
jgi:hypothetical protein